MSYTDEVAAALAEVGIRGRRRRRIVLELEDHLACDPGAETRLGDPRELAAEFAAELASAGTKRTAFGTFAALAGVAAGYAAPLLAIDRAGGSPDLFAGTSAVLGIAAGMAMLVAPQVAFVAGILAAARAVRRRGEARLPAAEVRLIQRRAFVAVGAGAVSMVAVALDAANFAGELPAWWTALAWSCSAAGLVLCAAAGVSVARIARVRSRVSGPAGGLEEDVPIAAVAGLAAQPVLLCAVVGLPVCMAAFLAGWYGEGTPADGLIRAIPEALAFLGGFAVLGRPLGIRR